MNKLGFNALSRETLSHNNQQILKHILICKYSNNTYLVDKNKVLLFRRLSFITVKQVNGFFSLLKNYHGKVLHTPDEIVAECFIVLDRCINKCDWKRNKKNFYFYYNKAVTNAVYRLYQNNYEKHCNCIGYKKEHEDVKKCNLDLSGLIDHYLNISELNEVERKIALSKLNGECMRDFLKKNKDLNKDFCEGLRNVREKLQFLKEENNGEINQCFK